MPAHVPRSLPPQAALADALSGAARIHAWSIVRVALAVFLLTASARIKVPVPGSPVPVTLQTLAVLITGFALGRRLAPAAVLVYVLLGAVGLPLFAVGWLPVSGGYLAGFAAAAAFVGRFGPSSAGWVRCGVVATLGTAIIFAFGMAWLACGHAGDWSSAWAVGGVPFLPAAALKTATAVALVQAWRFGVGRRR